jgi:hypothetical protein
MPEAAWGRGQSHRDAPCGAAPRPQARENPRMKKPPGAARGRLVTVDARSGGGGPGRNPRANYIPNRGASRCQAISVVEEALSSTATRLRILHCSIGSTRSRRGTLASGSADHKEQAMKLFFVRCCGAGCRRPERSRERCRHHRRGRDLPLPSLFEMDRSLQKRERRRAQLPVHRLRWRHPSNSGQDRRFWRHRRAAQGRGTR